MLSDTDSVTCPLLSCYFVAACFIVPGDNMYRGDNTTTVLDEGCGTFITSKCYF